MEHVQNELTKSSYDGPFCGSFVDGQDRDFTAIMVEVLEESKPLSKVPRVPSHFKHRKDSRVDRLYDPIIISLGPYHHGKPEYSHAELFKQLSLNAFVSKSGNGKDELFFYDKILERIQEIRDCYEEVEYEDPELALLMLRDACFVIYLMELASSSLSKDEITVYYNFFGIGAMNFIGRDLLLLENQIPFWIIKLLVCSRSEEGKSTWNKLLVQHINRATSMHLETFPWAGRQNKPFHFLDAVRYYHMMPVKALDEHISKMPLEYISSTTEIYKETNFQFRTATNLKAKGIRFKASNPTKGNHGSISFTSHAMYGQLTLPPLTFSVNFFVLYSNFIAYEIFPTSNAKLYATAYVDFIKSLIETPNDVKILREEGILSSNIGSDTEVVQMIKDLNTFGVERSGVFRDLKKSITDHCRNKSKTWAGELIYTSFRRPWITLAVFVAFAFLLLTFFQTCFVIYVID